ncbi:hypothetical protein GMD78_10790 [Ornithinibacillus sp. L9]|uniref:CTP synthase n=1 Tax=Ornithinibacillus caprae TaxID=2678566 RepID=A0A6N8FMA7_9BACI|nr:DUF6241 domain-containing protein [Ornithinibacillus caprae]MUK88879.1 hypothetical protein [Ornithinibacillus caprae]
MYKVVITVLIVSFIVLLSVAGWHVYKMFTNNEEATENISDEEMEAAKEELEQQRIEIQGNIKEEDLNRFADEGLNPFGQTKQMHELNDIIYQEYIHGMAHQKVKASEKWGFYEIHPERIQWLLDGLNEVNLKHETIYRDILEKWAKGDFSSADADHNTIWRLQGGTIGKATGVYSPEEEKAYLEKQSDE